MKRHLISSVGIWLVLFAWAIAADNIWDASTDSDGNTAANWSLNQVPTGTDVAVYDSATTNTACNFSGNVSCTGMRFDNTYSGKVDGVAADITLGASGLDCTGGGSATLDLGSGIWTCSGSFDYGDIGSLDDGSSTVVMSGSGKELICKVSTYLYNLTISDSTTIPAASGASIYVAKNLTVNASLEITSGKIVFVSVLAANQGTLDVGVSGDINGDGECHLSTPGISGGLNTMLGTIRCAVLRFDRYAAASLAIPAKSYAATTVRFRSTSGLGHYIHDSGTTTFTGNVSYTVDGTANLTIANSTNDPTLVYQGDVTVTESSTGNLIWTEGTGDIAFRGGNNQSVDLSEAGVLESITVSKTGNTCTLTGDIETGGNLLYFGGTFNADTYDVTVAGQCSGFPLVAALTVQTGTGTWYVGGRISFTAFFWAPVITGTATWEIDGAGAQDLDWGDNVLTSPIVINKAGGTARLLEALSCTTFTGTLGTFDPNGKTVTTTGACTWSSGFDFANAADAMNGCTWVVGNNFSADGQDMLATTTWTLTVTGTGTATDVDVEYSDADAGSVINALDATSVNRGNNFGWNFGAGRIIHHHRGMMSHIRQGL